MVSTHVRCDISNGAVMTCRPGSFQPDESPSAASGQIVDKSAEVGDLSVRRRFLEVVAAEVGDVDITKADVLVSVGRGIEDEDNMEDAKTIERMVESGERKRELLEAIKNEAINESTDADSSDSG